MQIRYALNSFAFSQAAYSFRC